MMMMMMMMMMIMMMMMMMLLCVSDADQVPVADAGGEQVIVLPAPLVTVNGSKSSDDRKIVSYLWTRDKNSPAAGVGNCSLVNAGWNICCCVLYIEILSC